MERSGNGRNWRSQAASPVAVCDFASVGSRSSKGHSLSPLFIRSNAIPEIDTGNDKIFTFCSCNAPPMIIHCVRRGTNSIKIMKEISEYIEPNNVTSPRRHWTLLMVLDPGSAGEIALCVGRWDDDPCLGIRWNGTEDNTL